VPATEHPAEQSRSLLGEARTAAGAPERMSPESVATRMTADPSALFLHRVLEECEAHLARGDWARARVSANLAAELAPGDERAARYLQLIEGRSRPRFPTGMLLYGALIALAPLLTVLAFVLSATVLGFVDDASRGDIFAAGGALAGVVIAQVVAVVGLALKRSVDDRTIALSEQAERRLQLDAERNLVSKAAEAHRQRVDTTIRAVQLLGGEDAKSQRSRNAGSALALSILGETEFALALIGELWAEDQVDASAAVMVVNDSLVADQANLQEWAANTLLANADKLSNRTDGGFAWPESLSWRFPDEELGIGAQSGIVSALVEFAVSRTPAESDTPAPNLNALIIHLSLIMNQSSHPRIAVEAEMALSAILGAYATTRTIHAPAGKVTVGDLLEQAAESAKEYPRLRLEGLPRARAEHLQRWAERVKSTGADPVREES